MKTKLTTILATVALAGAVVAAPQTFNFKDPKGVNNVVFKTDAILESINGSANGVSGTVTFDPEKPADTKGKIVVTTASLTVPNPVMNGHLHSDKWLDVSKHPEITFESKELKNVKANGAVTTADSVGTFTLKGVSKEVTVPITITYLKDKLGQRVPNQKGDLLVIRAHFTIKRSDFNVNPGQFEDKVSNEIDLTLSVAGASPK